MSNRYSASVQGGAGSVTLPSASLYAGANLDLRLMEVHVFNTTAISCLYNLLRLDTTGTKPAAEVDAPYDPNSVVAEGGVSGTHTVAPTLDEIFERLVLGTAIGSGVILTFGKEGLLIPKGTANGIGLILNGGTGQIANYTFVWEE